MADSSLCGLEPGKFYEDKEGRGLYFITLGGRPVVDVLTGSEWRPTRTTHGGLASVFHDNDIDVTNFRQVNPLDYLEQQRKRFNKLLDGVKKYHPSLQPLEEEIVVE